MRNLRSIIRKLDYTQDEGTLEQNLARAVDDIEKGNYDFTNHKKELFTKNGKKRWIYSFDSLSTENILCHYLKHEIDKAFHVKYTSRSKIINLIFNTLPVIKDMNDFVIIRADFKEFFNSVLTEHVYKSYIKESLLSRSDKEILEQYISVFDRCYAGLCLSNEMAEIVSRDFDRLIKARLEKFGIFFYERFVDDMLIMLNSYIDQNTFVSIISSVIGEVFGKCPVKLSTDQNKSSFITHRGLQNKASIARNAISERFVFLGYEFSITYDQNKKSKISFEYGISDKKRERYKHIIELAFIDYRRNRNVELFRQRIKMFSSRTVIARSIGNNRFEWLTNGVTANYNELRFHIDDINVATRDFLDNLYMVLLAEYGIDTPFFLNQVSGEDSIYNLLSCLRRNRSIIFEERIGVRRRDLIHWIEKIKPDYISEKKRYYQIVMEYFELLDVNSTIS